MLDDMNTLLRSFTHHAACRLDCPLPNGVYSMMYLSWAVSIAHDYLQPALSAADKDAMWGAVKTNVIDIGLQMYTAGPTFPFAYETDNFGVTINSGLVAACLSFYERDPAATSLLLQYALAGFVQTAKLWNADSGAGGVWFEGNTYASMVGMYSAFTISSVKTALGTDQVPTPSMI
jgi:hypothetical protein